MPSKKIRFENGKIYHLFNRGVEKRDIFIDKKDYFRFVSCLYEMNSKGKILMREKIEQKLEKKKAILPAPTIKRERLIDILSFCLMPNHYHLIVRQLTDNGISLFMKKLGDGYVGYFNSKYDRRGMGSLFQGRFKTVQVEKEEQLINLFWYIFVNPLDLIEKDWKEEGIKDVEKILRFLNSYRWSSYLDSIGKKNFPSIIDKSFLTENLGSPEKIKKTTEDRIREFVV